MSNPINKWSGGFVSAPQPRVYIEPMVRRKIMHWVRKAGSKECSGLMGVIIHEGAVVVVEAFMVEQTNSVGDTELDAMSICKALYAHKDKPYVIRGWWHSHHLMDVFWSGTDVEAIKQLGKEEWFLNIVFNAKGETRTCIYGNQPFEFCFDELPLKDLSEPVDAKTVEAWDTEYTTNVKTPVVTSVRQGNFQSCGWAKDQNGNWAQAGETRPLSKKEQKRLKRLRAQTQMAGGDRSGVVTASEHMELETNGNYDRVPLQCLVCGHRTTCVCTKARKDDAWEFEHKGICWCCRLDTNVCACVVFEYRISRDMEIEEMVLQARRNQPRPKGTPPTAPDGASYGVG